MTARSILRLTVAAALLGAVPATARAQKATLQLEDEDLYAGAPFALSLVVEGFAENPQPTVADFTVAGCRVTPLGVSPSVRSAITIVNGRRNESRRVTFVHRFQLVCSAAGRYQVPALSIAQGSKRVTTSPGKFVVRDLAATHEMALRLGVPARPVTVGETFDLEIDWYLKTNPDNPAFDIALFDRPDAFEVSAPAASGPSQDTLPFVIGGRPVALPYARDTAELDGTQYTRFRFSAQVTPLLPGRIDLPPARVVAKLQTGWDRDAFGFRVPKVNLFKAEDQARTIEVTPLPAQGRPPSFAGAVGAGFAIELRASQTVVRVGNPLELEITIRGAGHLEGVGLPDLRGPGGLPVADFEVPATKPAGTMIEDGKAKRFTVTARLLRPVTQIPPIELAYWDPAQRAYQVVRSQATALSVAGSAMVGASDVVDSTGTAREKRPAQGGAPAVTSVVGADLSPSARDATLRPVMTMDRVRPLLFGLYIVPTLILGVTVGLRRRRQRGAASGASRAALAELDHALARAAAGPAREVAPAIASALRAVLRAAGRPQGDGAALIAALEERAYDPRTAEAPLPAELCARARNEAAAWRPADRGPGAGGGAAAAILLLASLGLPWVAHAGDTPSAGAAPSMDDARDAYQSALGESDRTTRTRAFEHAAAQYSELVAAHPMAPELMTDWGNASLGAADFGHAALAYRRALALDPDLERARKNLGWLRAQQPSWAAAHEDAGAVNTLLFWHRGMTRPAKHVWAALGYALAVLLLVPFGAGGRLRLRRRLAVVPALVTIAMIGSLAFARDRSGDAVVVADGAILRAADSPGAPPVLAEPIPAGAEVTIREGRDAWQRVALAGGATGWLPAGTLARLDGAPD